MTPSQLQLLQLLRRNNVTITHAIREKVAVFVEGQWNSLGSWRDTDIARFENAVLPVVTAGERRIADITNTYVASVEAASTGAIVRPAPVAYAAVTGAVLRGVEPSVVFRRPQMVMNHAIASGKTVSEAVAAGSRRARSLATTNLQLSRTHTAAKQTKFPYFRRVLTGAENCAMCAIASTKRFTRGNLMPIHPGCDCGVEPIIEAQPPPVIDPDFLESIHKDIESHLGFSDRGARDLGIGKTDARGRPLSDYTDLIITRNHGELGPTLSWRGDHFRGASEAAELIG